MNTMTEKSVVSAEAYQAIYRPPPRVMTSEEMLEHQLSCFVAHGFAKREDADPFWKRLENSRLLFVPKKPAHFDLAALMAMIELAGKRGTNYLNVQSLKDLIEVPETPYLMTDVEDGGGRLNTNPSVSREAILAEKRSPFVTFEGIAFGIVLPVVLTHHNLDLVGSQYDAKHVPGLFRLDVRPALSSCWGGSANPEWGAPSCGSRLVA